MSFGINKCTNMVIKPLNFVNYIGCEDPTFYFEMFSIHKETTYTYLIYLGIPISNDLSFKPIIDFKESKVQKSSYSFFSSYLIK